MPFLLVDGHRVHFLRRAQGPAPSQPLVFLHGAGGSHRIWLYQLRDLPWAHTYALDLPGHGQSRGPGRDSISGYADWLVAFLDAGGLDQVVLVGHSMGGAIAMQVALQCPSRVAGLGLISTGARLRVAPGLIEALRTDFQAAVAFMGEWAYGPGAPEELVLRGQRELAGTDPQVVCADFLACDGFSVLDRLGEITAPTLVLCGTEDRMTPVKYAVYLRDHIGRSQLHLVEGAGHMLMLERPAEVAAALEILAPSR